MAGRGRARRGWAGHDKTTQGFYRTLGTRRGWARQGRSWRGKTWQDNARNFYSYTWNAAGLGTAWPGGAWQDNARFLFAHLKHGVAGRGKAGPGKTTQGTFIRTLGTGPGLAGRGMTWQDNARNFSNAKTKKNERTIDPSNFHHPRINPQRDGEIPSQC